VGLSECLSKIQFTTINASLLGDFGHPGKCAERLTEKECLRKDKERF